MGNKLTIFLIDGNEYGPRTVEIGNWSGKAIYSSRSALPNVLSRDEFENPGVYILKSIPDDNIYSEKIYVGEAENLKIRVKQHLSNPDKEFTEFIGFISKDDLLTKSHIKYLESRIVTLAKEAKTSEIENGTAPSLPTLHEADISDMEYFLDQIKLILPVVSYKVLIPSVTKNIPSKNREKVETQPIIYHIKSNKLEAQMYESDQGIIVLNGSQCSKTTSKSISIGRIKIREKLLDSGVLIDKDKNYVFSEDTIFSSPSAASSTILGRQAPGPITWVDEKGITYKENQKRYFEN